MISANGLYYEDSGSGNVAVVFLHYFGSSGSAWSLLAAALCDHVRCIVPDLRGFGKSQSGARAFQVEDYADDVAELIRSLRLEKYVLVGHSMGGKIALALAARRPAGLQSLVLLAPSPPTPEPMDDDARDELRDMFGDREKIEAHLKKLCARPLPHNVLYGECAQHLMASAAAWNAWIDGGSREDISDGMATINVPALVISGEDDEGITPELLRREVAARVPQARLGILADTGHLLPLERHTELASLLQDWLNGT